MTEERDMPFVTVQTVKGILDNEQKKRLLERLTDVLVEIEGNGNPAFRKEVWVRLDEQEPNHWMRCGVIHTAEGVAKVFGEIGPDGNRK
jgi:4-oxalocrotonate tautomerase